MMIKKGSRGFVTLATGRMEFFMMARNLLRSYRFFSNEPLPFAIICDKENKFTEQFDDVVLLPGAKHSYLDKLSIINLAPYEKTIFIDSDCLAYRDLNDLWEVFKDAPPFSSLGSVLPFSSDYGWFKREDVGIFSDKVKFHIAFHGGIYYIERLNPALGTFSGTVSYVSEHFQEFRFRMFKKPTDEAVFSLAMAVHGFSPMMGLLDFVCFLPMVQSVEADIRVGALSFDWVHRQTGQSQRYEDVYLLHWGHQGKLWLFFKQTFTLVAESEGLWRAFRESFYIFSIKGVYKKLIPYRLKRVVYLMK